MYTDVTQRSSGAETLQHIIVELVITRAGGLQISVVVLPARRFKRTKATANPGPPNEILEARLRLSVYDIQNYILGVLSTAMQRHCEKNTYLSSGVGMEHNCW